MDFLLSVVASSKTAENTSRVYIDTISIASSRTFTSLSYETVNILPLSCKFTLI